MTRGIDNVLLVLSLAVSAAVASSVAAQTQAPEPDRIHAVQLFLQAREALLRFDVGNKRDVLLGIVGVDLANVDQITEARQTIDLITSDETRDVYLRPFLQVVLIKNQLAEAERAVQSMKTLGGRAEGLCYLASAQWKIGQRKQARKSLSEAQDIYKRNKDKLTYENFLEPLAEAQSELGDSTAASKTRRLIADLPKGGVSHDIWYPEWTARGSKSYELLMLGRSEAEKGDIQSARATFQRAVMSIGSIPDDRRRTVLLYVIAADQAKAGDAEGARGSFELAVLKALANPELRIYFLREIACAQANAGQIDGSMMTAGSISDSLQRDRALHKIAVAKLRLSGLESSRAIVEEIQTTAERDATLVDMAHWLAKRRDSNLTLVVEQVGSPYLKAEALREAAEVLGHVGWYCGGCPGDV
ncbi:MAG: hypothetical protein ABSG16_23495 [Candidatus Acidiferrum sp.]|jgi:tetratricopeptide (TPR) repeat protein